ncbi:MAG: type I restriction endonuclease subunit R [Polyangiales bacterium]
MTTDTSERALEALIVASLTSSGGYTEGTSADYARPHGVDLPNLLSFLEATQPVAFKKLGLGVPGTSRDDFLARLRGEVAKRGIVEVLRKGVAHQTETVRLYFGRPTAGNPDAAARFAQNRFTVTRQLKYSGDDWQRALDLALFVNGLPVATFELKNTLTKQTAQDAIEQYRRDRDPRELLFQFGRCLVHFAVDDQQVFMCTELKGQGSWFLPFNKGNNDGAGNPPNPAGIATDYLWREVLARDSLCDIIENFAQLVEEEDREGRKKRRLVFPRYHQLAVVRRLLADASTRGIGQRYLIQHSAGSGKSNSISWLAHQLIGLQHASATLFDSIIVVTDRRVLDKQLRDNIKQFAHASSVVGVALHSGDLAKFLRDGKKIITTTVQKFPFVLDELEHEDRTRRFAIVIDEAHSSQGGKTMEGMHKALGVLEGPADEADYEDVINNILERRKLLKNASYFAFTATPKNKTLEMFGTPMPAADKIPHRPFHVYSMRQAIEEGFILDVLKHYTPVQSWYRLLKATEDDPRFDVKRAQKKLRAYVESHDKAVRSKAEVMVDHFLDEVVARKKIGGKARAMVVAPSIRRAIQYKAAFDRYLKQLGNPCKAIVAFSGEHDVDAEDLGGEAGTTERADEARLNGFPSADIPEKLRTDPYRFLIVADKYQTGFDEPLLHTMYVDKALNGPKAVQTLSRLNRAHPQKYDCFVLDFVNDEETIRESFATYYTTTVLSDESDPNKLHDLKADLDGRQVYAEHQVKALVKLYLDGAPREKLDPILDLCVEEYRHLDEDGQVDFKAKAKAFLRTYNFLATVLSFGVPAWEELSIFLNMLVPRLPAPKEDDLSKGILETIDLDSYRIEVRSVQSLALPAQEAEIGPVPASGGKMKPEPELEYLSMIVRQFNELFGNVEWKDKDQITKLVTEEIPKKVAADEGYQNALKNSDRQNAKIEHDRALEQVIVDLVTDHAELFKQFSEHGDFKKWLTDHSFRASSTSG